MRISRQPSPVPIMKDQKQLENVEYFNHMDSMITNNARRTWEFKSRIVMTKKAFNKKNNLSTCKFDLNLRKNLAKCYPWSTNFYSVETWTFRKVDHKCGAGEGRRISVGPIVWEMEKCCKESRNRAVSYVQYTDGWINWFVTSRVKYNIEKK